MTVRWQPEWALELALGTLVGDDRDAAIAAVAASPEARAEVAAARELVAGLTSTGAAADPPPAALRAQVLSATDTAAACLGGFARRVADLFDIGEEDARQLLTTVDGSMVFEPAEVPGVELAHVAGGPRVAGADAGIVRFPPGLVFPFHEHVGAETQLVLSGSFVTDDGREYLPGDVLRKEVGTRHSFVVGKDEPCVLAVVLDADIRILR